MSGRTQGFMIGVAVGIALHYAWVSQQPMRANGGT